MVSDPAFRVTVFDKAFTRLGWVGDPVALTVTPRHNLLPTATVTVDADHPRTADLMAEGSRVTVHYDGELVLSGPVRLRQGARSPVEQFTFHVEGDWRVLQGVLGWQVPGAAISAQNTAEYRTVTGPAETVVKTLVAENATRLGLPLTVAADQARGDTVTVQVRMHRLADRLLPAVDLAGVGVSVVQSGAGLLLDCYEPAQHPRTLTEQSGVVDDWSLSYTPPSATRVVVGGPGEGTARTFRTRVDSAAEALWAMVVEDFVDARDLDADSLTLAADMDARGDAFLAEHAAKSGLSVTLAETSTFRYGTAVRVGDRVRIEVGTAGQVVEDVLREAVLSWTRDEGVNVTPMVGERTDDPSRELARAVSRVARSQRITEAGR